MVDKSACEKEKINGDIIKLRIEGILAEELFNCRWCIDASFEYSQKRYLFSCFLKDDKSIRMKINLETVVRLIKSMEIPAFAAVYFCSYFISSYIKQLEKVFDSSASSFFKGLTILNMINDIESGKVNFVYIPVFFFEQFRSCPTRPAEVQTAIWSLTRLLISFQDKLSSEQSDRLEKIKNEMMVFSGVAEVSCTGKDKFERTLFSELSRLKALYQKDKSVLEKYKLLSAFSDSSFFDNFKADDVIRICEASENKFLAGMVIRVACTLPEKIGYDGFGDFLRLETDDFMKNSISYLRNYSDFNADIHKVNVSVLKKMLSCQLIADSQNNSQSEIIHIFK